MLTMVEVKELIEKILGANGFEDFSFLQSSENTFGNIDYCFVFPNGLNTLDYIYPISLPSNAYLIETQELELMIIEQLPLGGHK